MSNLLGLFAFKLLSIGNQHFALNNKSILRKKLGEIGQNMILLYLLKIERSLAGLDAARGEVLHHGRPQQRATFSLCGSKRKMHNDG